MLIGALGSVRIFDMLDIDSASNIGLVLHPDANELAAFVALWRLHNADFTINTNALGTPCLGFALGAYYSGLTAP